MHLSTLGAFIALDVVLCIIPGPAVMAVVGAALASERAGFSTALGILTGNAIYFIVSALGLATVLLASHDAFVVLKWCGAAYLAYLGVRSIAAREAADPLAGSAAFHAPPPSRGWATGTITQLANPKALVFFVAIVPQFIDPHAAFAAQVIILGIASLVIELGVLSAYVAAAQRIRARGIAPRSRAWAERIGGALLLCVAAAVIRESS
jgi:threonine/homoserine/homoserine lactone efflux protein